MAPFAVKKRFEKTHEKVTQKGHAGKAGLETVGPLNQDNMRHLSSKTVIRTHPGVPSGTVADFCGTRKVETI